MAYDEELAARIRALVQDDTDVTERAMFGGLAFLTGGHMAVAAGSRGALMVRCDPDATDSLAERPGACPMIMRGRAMLGWLEVDRSAVSSHAELRDWVRTGLGHARSLPPK